MRKVMTMMMSNARLTVDHARIAVSRTASSVPKVHRVQRIQEGAPFPPYWGNSANEEKMGDLPDHFERADQGGVTAFPRAWHVGP